MSSDRDNQSESAPKETLADECGSNGETFAVLYLTAAWLAAKEQIDPFNLTRAERERLAELRAKIRDSFGVVAP